MAARRPSPGSARLADVARAAGVSAMTVSRALRMPGRVATETRARIDEAVRALGYVPNLVAGALRSQRSRIVVAIVPTLTSAIFAETVEGMTEALREQGYQLLLANSGYAAGTEESLVTAFLGRRPDGMILTGTQHTPGARAQLRAAGIPVVETWELAADPIDMNVGFSNRMAGHAHGGQREVAREAHPALTTVRVPGREMGRRAAEMILERLAGGAPAPRLDLGFEVVLRESA
mgnify:CR=1 FL=1